MGIEREEISFTDWFMRYAKAKVRVKVRHPAIVAHFTHFIVLIWSA